MLEDFCFDMVNEHWLHSNKFVSYSTQNKFLDFFLFYGILQACEQDFFFFSRSYSPDSHGVLEHFKGLSTHSRKEKCSAWDQILIVFCCKSPKQNVRHCNSICQSFPSLDKFKKSQRNGIKIQTSIFLFSKKA